MTASKTTKKPPFILNATSVDYTYEDYGCYGCYGCETGDDYCRGSSYEGLDIDADSIDVRRVLSDCIHVPEGDVPQDLVDLCVAELGLDKAEAYEPDTYGDYYGDVAFVEFADPKKVTKVLTRYFASKK